MRTRALILALIALPTLALALATRAFAQGPATFVAEVRVPSSSPAKYPHVDTIDRTVYVAGTSGATGSKDTNAVRLWSKQDSASAGFTSTALMGAAVGTPDFNSAAVAAGPDGALHYAWSNQATRQVLYRAKAPGSADFGPERVVATVNISPGPIEVEVGANEDGVFVFWRESGQAPRYRRSTDGVNWSTPTITIGAVATAARQFEVASAANGRLALAFTGSFGDILQGYVAIWNRSTFVVERVPGLANSQVANPSVAFLPDGTLAVALRGTESTAAGGAGVYTTDRAPNGTWSAIARLTNTATDFVALDADELGNVHLGWINSASGNDLWYIARRAGTAYSGTPLLVETGSFPLFNIRAAAQVSDRSYGHFVGERFFGTTSILNYFLFGLPVTTVTAQSIAIEGGAATTNKATVAVSFASTQGSPSEVRWRWNAPPTDAANDSGGYKPFANPLSVAAPATDPALCTTATLYTQLRASPFVQSEPNADSVLFDKAVQSDIRLVNPRAGYAIGYTNQPTATITVENSAECSGLASATVAGPITGDTLSLDVAGKPALRLDVPLAGGPGAKTLTFTATDTLGNLTTLSRTIVYDTTPPALPDGGTAVAPNPRDNGTVIVDLTLTGFTASDDQQLYGILVTPTVTPGAAPATAAATTGAPILIPFAAGSLTAGQAPGTQNFSVGLDLSKSLPREALVAGSYAFEIRVVDAAGNPSAETVTRAVQIDAITFPMNLPLLRK